MARGKVVHGTDGCTVLVEGDVKKRREPSTHVIKFPGGYIEVTRTSNQEYWAHIRINQGQALPQDDQDRFLWHKGEIVDSRVDVTIEGEGTRVLDVAPEDLLPFVNHIAVRVTMTND